MHPSLPPLSTLLRRSAWFLSLALAAGLPLACGDGAAKASRKPSERLVPAVEAVQARSGALPLVERLTGLVEAVDQVEIRPRLSAIVEEVLARDGDVVQRGQVLVRLRDREYRDRLDQATASHRIAVAQAKQARVALGTVQADLERAEALAAQSLASPRDLESARAEAASAEADLELAEARVDQALATVAEREEALSETVIRAPVGGAIGNRAAEVGMQASPAERLFTVGRLDSVRIGVVLTDRMLGRIETGQRVDILPTDPGEPPLLARLSRISPFPHPTTHSTAAEIDLANPDAALKPGMFVAVDVRCGESEQATLVPLSALYDNPASGVTGVWVSREPLGPEWTGATEDGGIELTEPMAFAFVPVDVVAKGRMEAGVRGVPPEAWVVSLGQNLLSGDSALARVRPVDWTWVESLQNLQRQDLVRDLMGR